MKRGEAQSPTHRTLAFAAVRYRSKHPSFSHEVFSFLGLFPIIHCLAANKQTFVLILWDSHELSPSRSGQERFHSTKVSELLLTASMASVLIWSTICKFGNFLFRPLMMTSGGQIISSWIAWRWGPPNFAASSKCQCMESCTFSPAVIKHYFQ